MVHHLNALIQPDPWLIQYLEQLPTQQCEAMLHVFGEGRQALAEPTHALGHDDPIRTQEPPALMAQRSPLLDEEWPGPMQRLHVLVRNACDRHNARARTTHRLADGGGIVGVMLMALVIRRHELGTDEADVMPKLPHLAGPVMGALTGFHTHATGRQLCHNGSELGAHTWLAYHHVPVRIDTMPLKHVVRQINPQYRHLHGWTPLLGILCITSHGAVRECSSKMGESIPLIRGAINRTSWPCSRTHRAQSWALPQASIPMRSGGRFAIKASHSLRARRFRSTTAPVSSMPTM
jgi:hypothetical protein